MLDQFKFLISRNPVYLIFQVTGSCNLNCSHCFNHKCNTGEKTDLALSEIKKISLNMGHVKYLTLAGGEPLVRDDLPEIASLFYQNNDLHVLNLVTNGWFTDRVVNAAEMILGNCQGIHFSIGVSVDGPEEIHDRLRGKKGSYKRALATINALKKLKERNRDAGRRLTIAVCSTYTRMNKDVLVELADFFRNEYSVPCYIGLIRGTSVPDKELLEIDMDHYMSVLKSVNYSSYTNMAGTYPFRHVRIAVDEIVSDIIYKSRKEKKMTVACKAGKKGFVLSADGNILLCEVLDKHLGNVRNNQYSPYSILNSADARLAMEQIKQENCHCTWECFQRLNVVFSPKLYPKVMIKSVQNRMTPKG